MANKTHIKKIQPVYFYDILLHGKRFEIRKNDCDYQVGDKVKLVLYNTNTQIETSSYIFVKITYILKDIPQYGLDKDYCIFGFRVLEKSLELGINVGGKNIRIEKD